LRIWLLNLRRPLYIFTLPLWASFRNLWWPNYPSSVRRRLIILVIDWWRLLIAILWNKIILIVKLIEWLYNYLFLIGVKSIIILNLRQASWAILKFLIICLIRSNFNSFVNLIWWIINWNYLFRLWGCLLIKWCHLVTTHINLAFVIFTLHLFRRLFVLLKIWLFHVMAYRQISQMRWVDCPELKFGQKHFFFWCRLEFGINKSIVSQVIDEVFKGLSVSIDEYFVTYLVQSILALGSESVVQFRAICYPFAQNFTRRHQLMGASYVETEYLERFTFANHSLFFLLVFSNSSLFFFKFFLQVLIIELSQIFFFLELHRWISYGLKLLLKLLFVFIQVFDCPE